MHFNGGPTAECVKIMSSTMENDHQVGISQQDAPFVEGRTFEMYEIQEKLDDYNSIMLVALKYDICKRRVGIGALLVIVNIEEEIC
ncbi:hypothetical protein T02_14875 [Trichinella nativa]|uniref:Uncharacterized protein n=1 Tax=Trichinella nativa TaxID=6335 RepID=A0A0V1LBM9_9BILA|nr:hypothetical protein T02_14875 [Trichinella nativa]